jgi:hypothetical protein
MRDEKMVRDERRFNLPHDLAMALKHVSQQRMMSQAAYCRQALAEKLERDGLLHPPRAA